MQKAKPIKELTQEFGRDRSTIRKWVRKAEADVVWKRRRETGNQAELAVTAQGYWDLVNYLSRKGYMLD